MIKCFRIFRACGLVVSLSAAAVSAKAAEFDYYLLALSWSPSWCAKDAGRAGAGQCAPERDLGFSLHGLWPQFETGGWPEFCETDMRDATRRETRAMTDIMGSSGLAWHQWQKHGRCSGLAAEDYFGAARRGFEGLDLPEPEGPASSAEIAAALVRANPGLDPEALIVTCRGERLAEVRICLTRDLAYRSCSAEVRDDACRSRGPLEVPRVP